MSHKAITIFKLFRNGGKFSKYDYGSLLNLARYGTTCPPEYDLSKGPISQHSISVEKIFGYCFSTNFGQFLPKSSAYKFI
jgi:hypothetical protein